MAQISPGYFICFADDMHPYNCGGPHGDEGIPPCKHCNRESTPTHKVTRCAFCISDKNEERNGLRRNRRMVPTPRVITDADPNV